MATKTRRSIDLTPRELLKDSLDKVFAEKIDPRYNLDAIEGKLFGLGVESYTVGSHEFYLGYAATHQVLLTLDAGHYHPTESVADKISAALLFVPEVLLHVSRGVRWDSDHVVILDDALQAIAQEIVRGGFPHARAHRIGLFRREYQSGGGVDDRGAEHPARTADGARGTDRATAPDRTFRRFHAATGAVGGDQESAIWRGVGLPLFDTRRAGRHAVHERD